MIFLSLQINTIYKVKYITNRHWFTFNRLTCSLFGYIFHSTYVTHSQINWFRIHTYTLLQVYFDTHDGIIGMYRMAQFQEDARDTVLEKTEKLENVGWEDYLNSRE